MAEIGSYKEDILHIFDQDLPWDKLSGANIFVTGATGLIGSCLVEALMYNPKRDYNVYASGRNEERAHMLFKSFKNDMCFHFIKYDVLQPLKCNICFDYIIHTASNASPNYFSKNPVEIVKTIVYGVDNLISYGLNHGMRRFVYVSSGEIYGEGNGRVLTEDYSGYVDCALPRSCYPSAKRAAETLCVSYASEYGADVVIARPCHIYGPNYTEKDNRVYAQFIRNVLRDEDIIMKSTGEQIRSYCYVVDCVSALLYLLLKGEKCQAYNIANPESNISIKKMAEIIAAIGNKKVVKETPDMVEKRGYNVVKKSIFSVDKLTNLGWSPIIGIKTGLRKTIAACLSNDF